MPWRKVTGPCFSLTPLGVDRNFIFFEKTQEFRLAKGGQNRFEILDLDCVFAGAQFNRLLEGTRLLIVPDGY